MATERNTAEGVSPETPRSYLTSSCVDDTLTNCRRLARLLAHVDQSEGVDEDIDMAEFDLLNELANALEELRFQLQEDRARRIQLHVDRARR